MSPISPETSRYGTPEEAEKVALWGIEQAFSKRPVNLDWLQDSLDEFLERGGSTERYVQLFKEAAEIANLIPSGAKYKRALDKVQKLITAKNPLEK